MPKASIVERNGARIPAIGLGTWPLEGDACRSAVATAIKSGYRHIDTAARYANEVEVGDGIRASGVPRAEIFVTTKVWWDRIADGDLQRSAEESLARLELDHVDLLLIHWPNPKIPLAGSIKALCETKRRGLTRHVGISNFPSRLIEEAVGLTSEPLVCNQIEYHPYLSQAKVLAACRKHGLALTAYCPLGRATQGGVLFEPAVAAIAKRMGRTPAQVVLRWLVQQPGVVAVPKSGTPARILENISVFDFELTADDMARISALARPDGRLVKLDWAPQWDT